MSISCSESERESAISSPCVSLCGVTMDVGRRRRVEVRWHDALSSDEVKYKRS
jgi:hypothetical protein